MEDSIEELSRLVKEIGFNTVPDETLRWLLDKYRDHQKVVEHLIDIRPQDSLAGLRPQNSSKEVMTGEWDLNRENAPGCLQQGTMRTDDLRRSGSSGADNERDALSATLFMPHHHQDGGQDNFDLDRRPRNAAPLNTPLDHSFADNSQFSDLPENEYSDDFCVAPEQPRGATIYYRVDGSAPEMSERRQIIELFKSEAVHYSEFDLTHDSEQTGLITAKLNGNLTLPIVFLSNRPIGGLSEVRLQIDHIKYECATQLVDSVTHDEYQHLSAVSSGSIRLGLIDRALNVGEVLLNYVNPLFWFYPRSEGRSCDNQIKEFTITQMNWYMRNQRRLLQFGADTFLKVNPDTNQVRAMYNYKWIKQIKRDGDLLSLIHADGHEDRFKAPPEVLDHLLALFRARCGPSLKS